MPKQIDNTANSFCNVSSSLKIKGVANKIIKEGRPRATG